MQSAKEDTAMEAPEQVEKSTEAEGGGKGKAKAKANGEALLKLPVARVRRIVKSDESIRFIALDAIVSITKATELFIEYLAQASANSAGSDKRRAIRYADVAEAIQREDSLVFLADVLPKKQLKQDGNSSLRQTTLM